MKQADPMGVNVRISDATEPYFRHYEDVEPPQIPDENRVWHIYAGVTVGMGLVYLHWRWTESLNPDAILFSIAVAAAETGFFLGTLIFFFDIWEDSDTPALSPPTSRRDIDLGGTGPICVDIFITTYDEDLSFVEPSIIAAKEVLTPVGCEVRVHLLDDGARSEFEECARTHDICYHRRDSNVGFKAGNLHNALLSVKAEISICNNALL